MIDRISCCFFVYIERRISMNTSIHEASEKGRFGRVNLSLSIWMSYLPSSSSFPSVDHGHSSRTSSNPKRQLNDSSKAVRRDDLLRLSIASLDWNQRRDRRNWARRLVGRPIEVYHRVILGSRTNIHYLGSVLSFFFFFTYRFALNNR